MGARVAVLSPNDDPNPCQNPQKNIGKSPIFENCQVPLKSLKLQKRSTAPTTRVQEILSPRNQKFQKFIDF